MLRVREEAAEEGVAGGWRGSVEIAQLRRVGVLESLGQSLQQVASELDLRRRQLEIFTLLGRRQNLFAGEVHIGFRLTPVMDVDIDERPCAVTLTLKNEVVTPYAAEDLHYVRGRALGKDAWKLVAVPGDHVDVVSGLTVAGITIVSAQPADPMSSPLQAQEGLLEKLLPTVDCHDFTLPIQRGLNRGTLVRELYALPKLAGAPGYVLFVPSGAKWAESANR